MYEDYLHVFAAIDGHGGTGHECANYVKNNFIALLREFTLARLKHLLEREGFQKTANPLLTKLEVQEQDEVLPEYDQVLSLSDFTELNIIKEGVKQTCQKLQNLLGRQHAFSAKASGVVMSGFVLIGTTHMLTFNVGDARTIMFGLENVQALTTDHTLEEVDEVDRIEEAGGVITYEHGKRPRIGGLLATRTLGDTDAHA